MRGSVSIQEKVKKILNTDVSSLLRIKKSRGSNKGLNKIIFSKSCVSIDLGSRYIKIAVGREASGKVVLDKLVKIKTPNKALNDGDISDKIRLSHLLQKELINEGIKVKETAVTSNSTVIINREIIVPKAEEDELDTLINYEIQQYLPINLNDYIVQYDVLEEIKGEDIDKLRVLVVTYPKRLARQYYDFTLSSGLKPKSLDINFNAVKKVMLRNMINTEGGENEDEKSTAIVDIGADTIEVNIYINQGIDFTRIIKYGGNAIDKEISKELKIDLKRAEACKIAVNNEDEEITENKKIIEKYLDSFKRDVLEELQRIFQFYINKKVGNKIDKIYLHGGGSRIRGLAEFLESELNISVNKVNQLENVMLSKNCPKDELDIYLNAIGAVIRL